MLLNIHLQTFTTGFQAFHKFSQIRREFLESDGALMSVTVWVVVHLAARVTVENGEAGEIDVRSIDFSSGGQEVIALDDEALFVVANAVWKQNKLIS